MSSFDPNRSRRVSPSQNDHDQSGSKTMSDHVGMSARFALGRRDVLRSAGLAAGAAALGGWLGRSAAAQETFVWYTGLATEASDAVTKQFTEKTGIPAEYFRAGSNNVVQKFDQERQA
ncbi:MAG: hypothetical protein ACREJ0_23465, partial [Geminicoccaceae bacterium]